MTEMGALQEFFSSFGIDAYPASSVSNEADLTFPYLTYEPAFDAFGGGNVNITVNLWYCTTDETQPNAKARELLSKMGTRIKCDNGYIWLKKGSPWCQTLSDDTNPSIKRRYINVECEFLTTP